jgi:hypothetical protein
MTPTSGPPPRTHVHHACGTVSAGLNIRYRQAFQGLVLGNKFGTAAVFGVDEIGREPNRQLGMDMQTRFARRQTQDAEFVREEAAREHNAAQKKIALATKKGQNKAAPKKKKKTPAPMGGLGNRSNQSKRMNPMFMEEGKSNSANGPPQLVFENMGFGDDEYNDDEMYDAVDGAALRCASHLVTGRECLELKRPPSEYCKKHTCGSKQCTKLKSSKAKFCKMHVETSGYIDVNNC